MTFIITAAAPPASSGHEYSDDDDVDSEGDVAMAAPSKRTKLSTKGLVTPGETVTDDPQWMR